MNPYADPDFSEFVAAHADADPSKLRLKHHGDARLEFAIVQVECRRRFARKLADTLSRCPQFVFPSVLAGEQSTSDALAAFHASLIAAGSTVTDLTAGLGIDAMHMARRAAGVTAVERREALAEALRWNAEAMGLGNIGTVCGDCTRLLADGALKRADTAFIDPARRAEDGSRIFAIAQYEPDVTAMLPALRRLYATLIVKASPMLDLTQTVRDVEGVTDAYVLGTATECKELLLRVDLTGRTADAPVIHAATVGRDGETADFAFTAAEESECPAPATARLPKTPGDTPVYIIEPLPTVMKAAPMKLLARRFGLRKIAPNTHVFVAEGAVDPGLERFARVWRLERVVPWASKNIKRLKNDYPRIDVAVRNFGMSADALRARLGVKAGNGLRLLGVTDSADERLMLVLADPAGKPQTPTAAS